MPSWLIAIMLIGAALLGATRGVVGTMPSPGVNVAMYDACPCCAATGSGDATAPCCCSREVEHEANDSDDAGAPVAIATSSCRCGCQGPRSPEAPVDVPVIPERGAGGKPCLVARPAPAPPAPAQVCDAATGRVPGPHALAWISCSRKLSMLVVRTT